MENANDMFNVNIDDYQAPVATSNNQENNFKPDPNLSRDKVYSAVVRPLYWLDNPAGFNPKANYIEKKTFYLKNDADEGGYFDSPFSTGEKCEAMDAFFKLKRDGKTDAQADEDANTIRPKSSFFYLVYVEKDLTTPENEGKVMVWKCPIQIHRLIDGKINPDEKSIKLGKKSEDICNPFTGRSLEVNVSLNKFWDYSGCEWQEKGVINFQGADLNEESKPAFADLVKTGGKMMEPFLYVPMSADRKALLLSIITEKTGITFGTTKAAVRPMEIEGVSDTSSIDDVISDIVADEAPVAKPAAKKEAAPKAEVKEDSAESINDFLEDLDLNV